MKRLGRPGRWVAVAGTCPVAVPELADAPVLLQQNGDDVAVRLLDGLRRRPGEITHR
jgi:hypothetical protein